jgi:ribosome biogenesis SPOUT family RNA methylase Rps3
MLSLVAPHSHLHFTSLSSTSIPPLQAHLSSHPNSFKAHTHSLPILHLLESTPELAAAGVQAPVDISRVCLLDPRAPKVLAPEDGDQFDWFLYGGILGDDPPRDRTAELRKLGFEGRHLDKMQMTTDTAVGVTKKVVEDRSELARCRTNLEMTS